jgi:hypothetical protein
VPLLSPESLELSELLHPARSMAAVNPAIRKYFARIIPQFIGYGSDLNLANMKHFCVDSYYTGVDLALDLPPKPPAGGMSYGCAPQHCCAKA